MPPRARKPAAAVQADALPPDDGLTPTVERFPRDQCDEAFDLWCLKRGAVHYGRFRNAFAPIWKFRPHAVNLRALEWALAFTDQQIPVESIAATWRRWCDIAESDPWDRLGLLPPVGVHRGRQ